jgi:hypothetical protein
MSPAKFICSRLKNGTRIGRLVEGNGSGLLHLFKAQLYVSVRCASFLIQQFDVHLVLRRVRSYVYRLVLRINEKYTRKHRQLSDLGLEDTMSLYVLRFLQRWLWRFHLLGYNTV